MKTQKALFLDLIGMKTLFEALVFLISHQASDIKMPRSQAEDILCCVLYQKKASKNKTQKVNQTCKRCPRDLGF